MYEEDKSKPTQFLFKSCAATRVVPLPTKGSNTNSPVCENNDITFLAKFIG